MVQAVEQREPIKSFLNFTSTFLISEGATIEEIGLVEDNLNILLKRIKRSKGMYISPNMFKKV